MKLKFDNYIPTPASRESFYIAEIVLYAIIPLMVNELGAPYYANPQDFDAARARLLAQRGSAPLELVLGLMSGNHSEREALVLTNPLFTHEIRAIDAFLNWETHGRVQLIRPTVRELSIYRAISKDKPGFRGDPDEEFAAIESEFGKSADEITDQELFEGILNSRVAIPWGPEKE